MDMAADLVLSAIDLAAQRCVLQQDVFEAEAEAFLLDVRWRWQFQLGFLDPEGPFEGLLNA